MRRAFICVAATILLLTANAVAQETNKFRVRVRSALTGNDEYQVTKGVDGYHSTGKLHTETAGRSLDTTHELTLTLDLKLARYKLQAGGTQVIEAWREGDNIQMKASAGAQSQTRTVPFTPSTLVLDNMITGHFQLLLDSIAAEPGTSYSRTFLVPQALSAIDGKISRVGDETGTLGDKSIPVRKYTVQVASSLAEFWADDAGRLMRVYIPVQDVEMVREGFTPAPKTEPKAETPSAMVERNVEFPSGTLKLPATLCLPAGASGKVPVVVLVHGSGAHDRDETIGPNKPFRELAHGLAAAGIGTLRYDKRTYAFKPPQLDIKTLTVEEETIADAVAALQFARTLPEADPARIFVLGHSQGAMFAPTIADRAEARGAILMAAAERPLDVVIPAQIAFQAKLAGMSDQQIATQVDELKKAFARIRSGQAKDDEIIFRAPARYWRDYLGRDTVGALKNLKVPALVLQGGKDVQVLKADYELALQALASKPPEMREAHFFPNLNHLFIPVEGEPTGAEYGIAGRIPQEVIQTITTWVKKQAAK